MRTVSGEFVARFEAVEQSGLIAELHAAEALVAHERVFDRLTGALRLYPERVPFISYPFEWTPRQLRDAALLTLDVAMRALRRGQVLRDATAFNVQFHRGRPILIDSLSFEPYTPGAPWMAYGQFCRHFLGPLALAALVDPELLRLTEVHSDGIPMPLASATLGRRGIFRSGVLVHLHLHAMADRHAVRAGEARTPRVSRRQFEQTLDGLQSTIESLPMPRRATPWIDYAGGAHYDESSRREKDAFVQLSMERVRPTSLWDLGANVGDMAMRHVPRDGHAVALDIDLGCVEAIYERAYRDRVAVTAIWRDLRTPTPATGWAAEEHAGLHERGPADMVLALALVHHLCVSGRVPPDRVVAWLASLARHLVVEVPDHDDAMVARLSAAPVDPSRFSRAEFRAAFTAHFEVLEERALTGLPRSLFLLRRRKQ